MLYERNLTLERRHYERLCGLFELESFRGKKLNSNNPLGAKRNDVIPVASETFDDGSVLTVTLKSDREHYFFHKELDLSDGRVLRERDEVEFPLDFDEPEPGRKEYFLSFKIYDGTSRDGYTVNVKPAPDRVYVVSVKCRSLDERLTPVVLYEGVKEDAPDMTPAFVGDKLARVLLDRYSENMSLIAGFLLDADHVVKEERDAERPELVFDVARSNNPRYMNECVKVALTTIEHQTRWAYMTSCVENDAVAARHKDAEP